MESRNNDGDDIQGSERNENSAEFRVRKATSTGLVTSKRQVAYQTTERTKRRTGISPLPLVKDDEYNAKIL